MTNSTERKPPKGGRKGGTQFPRVDLKQAHEYAKKLVSKTHAGAQPEKIILKGVFDRAGPIGRVRASALKQYGLMEGEPTAYQASSLAKQMVAAPPDELRPLLQKACLIPKLFKNLFDTFQNDTVAKAKIRQQAMTLEVHPDTADECVKVFAASLEYASLAQAKDDQLMIGRLEPKAIQEPEGHEGPDQEGTQLAESTSETLTGEESGSPSELLATKPKGSATTSPARVNIDVDSSMDPEKLEKLLKLLKQYGAI
jgi:hypothetical protein